MMEYIGTHKRLRAFRDQLQLMLCGEPVRVQLDQALAEDLRIALSVMSLARSLASSVAAHHAPGACPDDDKLISACGDLDLL